MMGNVGAAFFRSHEEKCPNCGTFSQDEDEYRECPSCYTRFNEYVILQPGQQQELQNN